MADDIKKTTCPMCGSDNYVDPGLTDEIKDAFIEHMLGDIPFQRIYDEMGGRIAVTVTSLSDSCARDKAKLMVQLMSAAEYSADIKARMPILESAIDVDSQVASVAIKTKDGKVTKIDRRPGNGTDIIRKWDWDKMNAEELSCRFDEALAVLDEELFPGTTIPKSLLRAAVGKHNVLLTKIMTECFDENFLRGTGRDY
jgi:hypothetical protein